MAQGGMSTRSKNKLSEDELEVASRRIKEKEIQLHEQAEALNRQREEFDLERTNLNRQYEQMEISMRARETEITRRENTPREHSPIASFPKPDDKSSPPPVVDISNYRTYPPDHSYDMPRVPFREALEEVPRFDGNNISLAQFTRACRRAKESVPPSSEKTLTRLLINKLRGRAFLDLENEACDTVSQLIDHLDASYGSIKTLDQCRGELSMVFMHPREHIVDYIIRVKDLRSSVLDCERRERGRVDDSVAINVDELTARSFCEGLPRDYRFWLRDEHYSKPSEAFAYAKILAKRDALDNERERPIRPYENRGPGSNVNMIGRPTAHSTPIRRGQEYSSTPFSNGAGSNNRTPPTRSYDQIRGPRAWQNNAPQYQQPPRNTTAPPTRHQGTRWCRYCKNSGHEIEECRKRQYNNSRRDQGNAPRPSGNQPDESRAAPPQTPTRPVQAISAEENAPPPNDESQC